MNMKTLDKVATGVVLVGGLNWGTIGLFGLNIVEKISFGVSWLATTVYIGVGIATVVAAVRLYIK